MAKVKNISGEHRIVQGRLVVSGADLDVEPDEVWSYTCQEPNWAPADDEAKTIHEAAAAASQPDVEPSLDWTKPQLVAYADQHSVDIADAKTKAEILDAINKHTPEG